MIDRRYRSEKHHNAENEYWTLSKIPRNKGSLTRFTTLNYQSSSSLIGIVIGQRTLSTFFAATTV